MKQFGAFVKKEFIHLLRDPESIAILILIPILLIILFGFAITTDVKNVKLGVCDHSKDEVTRRIIEKFNNSTAFQIVADLSSIEEVNTCFETDKIDLALVFDSDFAADLMHTGKGSVQIIADASNPNVSILATNYAVMIIQSYQMELMEGMDIPIVIQPVVKMLYNPLQLDAYNFVPGIIGIILTLICALMTAASIVRERELGTMEVLLVSPMKPIYIIVAKLIPYFILSLIDLGLILFLSVYVLKVPIVGNLFTLLLLCVLFILVSLSMGMLISTFAKTQMDAMIIAGIVLMVPTLLLSGMIFPISNMPQVLQWLSALLPMTWFVEAIKKVMIEGLPLSSIAKECFILLLMGAVCLFISLKKFKIRLE